MDMRRNRRSATGGRHTGCSHCGTGCNNPHRHSANGSRVSHSNYRARWVGQQWGDTSRCFMGESRLWQHSSFLLPRWWVLPRAQQRSRSTSIITSCRITDYLHHATAVRLLALCFSGTSKHDNMLAVGLAASMKMEQNHPTLHQATSALLMLLLACAKMTMISIWA